MNTKTQGLKPRRLVGAEEPELKDWPATLRFGPELRAQIDDWRRWQSDLPARAEAVRRLVEIGLYHESRK